MEILQYVSVKMILCFFDVRVANFLYIVWESVELVNINVLIDISSNKYILNIKRDIIVLDE